MFSPGENNTLPLPQVLGSRWLIQYALGTHHSPLADSAQNLYIFFIDSFKCRPFVASQFEKPGKLAGFEKPNVRQNA
jgi:hypothetical protein